MEPPPPHTHLLNTHGAGRWYCDKHPQKCPQGLGIPKRCPLGSEVPFLVHLGGQ